MTFLLKLKIHRVEHICMVPMIHKTDGWFRFGSADYRHLNSQHEYGTWVPCGTGTEVLIPKSAFHLELRSKKLMKKGK
jgi:hypothetical protein